MKARFSRRIKLFGSSVLTITVGFFIHVGRAAETAAPEAARASTAIVKEAVENEGSAAAEGAAKTVTQEAVKSTEHESGGFLHTLAHRGLHKALEGVWDKCKEMYGDYKEYREYKEKKNERKQPVYDPRFQYRPPYGSNWKTQDQSGQSTRSTVRPTVGLKLLSTQTGKSK